MVVLAFDTSIQEAEAAWSPEGVPGKVGLHSETRPQKSNKQTKSLRGIEDGVGVELPLK